MSMHLSFAELVDEAARLDFEAYEEFLTAVNKVRAKQRRGAPGAEEAALLEAANQGFPSNQWLRMLELDAKMEASKLSEAEYAELTKLTETYELFSIERLQVLKKLASLRNVGLEDIMAQMGLKNGRN